MDFLRKQMGVYMKKILLIGILISFSIGWSSTNLGRGEIDGFFDYRYIWSEKVYAGTGTFQLNNLNLMYNFPLNRSYKVFLQTNISPTTVGSQIIKQLFLDSETSLPLKMRLGRFKVETMERDKDQDTSSFISGPIFWDLNWKIAGNPVLPDIDTGVELYNTGKNHDMRFYLLNGANDWVENTTESKKAFGGYFRTLFKNIIEVRGSVYTNLHDSGNYNHTVFTGETSMELADIKFKTGLLVLLGKNFEANDNGIGGIFEVIMPISSGMDLAGFASIYKDEQYFYRGVIAIKSTLNQDMIWKNEFCIEKDNTTFVKEYKLQSQLVVLL